MFSIKEIIRRDAETYYEFDNKHRISRAKTIFIFAVSSILVGGLVGKASNDFLAGALSAQAILVGFSFNVLFYLVANRLGTPARYASIEHELRFERLSRLSDEVFDNVTYFNLVAIFSALAALILLLAASEHYDANLIRIAHWIGQTTYLDAQELKWLRWAVSSLTLATLLFLLAESIYTFLRAVGRVRFYFSMLKTMDADNS